MRSEPKSSPMLKLTKHDILGGLFILVALGLVAWMQQDSLKTLQAEAQATLTTREYERQDAQTATQLNLLARVPSFGFENLLGDWAFLQFLQYFGDWRAREATNYDLAPDFFKIIIPRDPKFAQAYVYLSTSVTLYAGQPDVTVALMDRGIEDLSPEIYPEAYLVPVYRAIDQLLFLGDSKAAAQSYELAADWVSYQKTPDAQASADYYRKTAKFLRDNPNSKQAQINSWVMVLAYAVSGRGQQLAIENLQRLGVKVTIAPDGRVQIER